MRLARVRTENGPRIASIGPYDDIVLPAHSTTMDWEVELAVIIGADLREASDEQCREAVAGGAQPGGPAKTAIRQAGVRRGRSGVGKLCTRTASAEPDDQAYVLVPVLGGQIPHRLPHRSPALVVRGGEHPCREDHGPVHHAVQPHLAARRPLRRCEEHVLTRYFLGSC
ncbi:fumarylacetoacetate hydrolase family protein [Nonomuraea sp. NEAU-A123]|nr:fumarylacetoacetate hydrolase family protein [Nonomuraea sp. NEAU-A123]